MTMDLLGGLADRASRRSGRRVRRAALATAQHGFNDSLAPGAPGSGTQRESLEVVRAQVDSVQVDSVRVDLTTFEGCRITLSARPPEMLPCCCARKYPLHPTNADSSAKFRERRRAISRSMLAIFRTLVRLKSGWLTMAGERRPRHHAKAEWNVTSGGLHQPSQYRVERGGHEV